MKIILLDGSVSDYKKIKILTKKGDHGGGGGGEGRYVDSLISRDISLKYVAMVPNVVIIIPIIIRINPVITVPKLIAGTP